MDQLRFSVDITSHQGLLTLLYLNFLSPEVVSGYREPQLQVTENYSDLYNYVISYTIFTHICHFALLKMGCTSANKPKKYHNNRDEIGIWMHAGPARQSVDQLWFSILSFIHVLCVLSVDVTVESVTMLKMTSPHVIKNCV